MEPWQERYSKNTLKRGQSSTYVKNMQTDLNKVGYSCGTPDGIFGSNTETAVINFQKANKLTADGEVGSGTKPVLYNASH